MHTYRMTLYYYLCSNVTTVSWVQLKYLMIHILIRSDTAQKYKLICRNINMQQNNVRMIIDTNGSYCKNNYKKLMRLLLKLQHMTN